jgi:uncharacterized membrane protein YhaH (DUF805 family)
MRIRRASLHWIDPECRIGRVGFSIALFLLISLAQALLRPINSIDYRRSSIGLVLEILVASVAVFSLMCVFLVKRLMDVGLSRYWALLISGPIFLYSLFAFHCQDVSLVKVLMIPAVSLFLVFIGLTLILLAIPSKSVPPTPDPPPGSPSSVRH